ncbi:vWA domain-containing protein [Mangrovibacillus cuniculi]|uniref:VWA domain-containing protein n=1 Tax=Mangrovibacillus cuniculi TaxID=2593652 RepID=A0A7S8HH98_9BACI|nr:VWA domain-containing protein [Mangrovibacillus cuniculi]QPC48275.1 VWA domain-containing protein [Mangrovibacillus cuniculi]
MNRELLPKISSQPSKEELDQYYRELVRINQYPFKGPEEAIKQLTFESFGSPDMEGTRYEFKENLNILVLLDASGSMANQINGKQMMDSAKDSINAFVSNLPEEANIGLRVYGHKGDGSDKNKDLSCGSSELKYPISAYEETSFTKALETVKPAGWTPIDLAIQEAERDLANYSSESNTNIIYLVSDGVETCNGDPVKAVKTLYDSNISPVVNIIGFDVDNEGEAQLKEMADTVNGIYQRVSDENELKKELDKINDISMAWEKWKKRSETKISSKDTRNAIDIFVYITGEEYNASFEELTIDNLLFDLKEAGDVDKESYKYLQQVNDEYHDWIKEEVEGFKVMLEQIKVDNYNEAKKQLEEIYQKNTQ